MFKITWDKETGGVKLNSRVNADTLGISPRPVFFEELDLLKLNELGWKYPKCKEPLLWACNKQYFYQGKLVFEVKGANIYDTATVFLQPEAEDLHLKPVDVEAMLENCKDEMFLIESEAIEFIRGEYIKYSTARESVKQVKANQLDYEALVAKIEKQTKRKMAIVKQDCDSFDIMPLDNAKQEGKKTYQTTRIDKFLASFSGGKDSQVVLDLCVRAIPPSAFEVIYSDTGYELPTSLTLYEEVKNFYKKKFPELKFSTARNHETVLNYWDKIGTPSDTHRWCCSVMKTAPLYRMLKIDGTNKQARVITFDGVRAEESNRRSEYRKIKYANI
ncbi:MAG: phosphoadenosine phosphosulfate reductase family protein [Prevotellaceae bacterium]|jgi:phosphoadenosine phosphosulfate reductase|nr:phosphoadenosine phosphosulfate reductase family protein [Prevotellaceae bacterium]